MSTPYRVRPAIAVLAALLAFQATAAALATVVFTFVTTDVLPVRFQLYTLCVTIAAAVAIGVLHMLLPDDLVVVVHYAKPEIPGAPRAKSGNQTSSADRPPPEPKEGA